MDTLTEPQRRALAALRAAAGGASLTGAVQDGRGTNLRSIRALEAAGLCTVEYSHHGGYVRHGRWLKPRPAWSAKITPAGMELCASAITSIALQ
jgi:hypothetical protein